MRRFARDDFITSLWREPASILEADLHRGPAFGFLRHPIIRQMMFVTAGGDWLKAQLARLEQSQWQNHLREVLLEDWAGRPILVVPRYHTSHNRVHHLYHWVCFTEATGCRLDEISHVVEWGGGYGDMARLFRRLGRPGQTYTIIDLPLMSCLQYVYLSATLGPDAVSLTTDGALVDESSTSFLSALRITLKTPMYSSQRGRWTRARRQRGISSRSVTGSEPTMRASVPVS